MSATIGNLDEVAQFLNADVYTRNFRPVEIKEYVKCDNQIWLLNLHEDPIFTDAKKINYRVSFVVTTRYGNFLSSSLIFKNCFHYDFLALISIPKRLIDWIPIVSVASLWM